MDEDGTRNFKSPVLRKIIFILCIRVYLYIMGEKEAYKLKINEAVRWSPLVTICLLVHVYRLYFLNHSLTASPISYLFSPQLMYCVL